MNVVLQTLLEISMMGSGIIFITLFVRRFFSKKMPLAVMTVLWSIALTRLLLPVTITSPVHLMDLLPEKAAVEEINTQATEAPQFPQELQTIDSVQENLNTDGAVHTSGNVPENTRMPEEPSLWQKLKAVADDISIDKLLFILWLAGALAVFWINILKSLSFKRKLLLCPPVMDAVLCNTLQSYCREVKIKRPVRMLTCDISLAITLMMLVACFTTACQPTPEERGQFIDDGSSPLKYEDITEININIQSIELCMVRTAIKDTKGIYRMVPAWKYTGSEIISVKDDKGETLAVTNEDVEF